MATESTESVMNPVSADDVRASRDALPSVAQIPAEILRETAAAAMDFPPARVADITAYLRTLAAEDRDVEGRLLPAGSVVLCNLTHAPAQFMEDTPRNRDAFAKLGYGWTPAIRQREFFADPVDYPALVTTALSRAAAAQKHFSAAINENLLSLRDKPFPRLSVPAYYYLIPLEWEPKVKDAHEVADLTAAAVRHLSGAAGLPADLACPAAIAQLFTQINDVRVYECRRSGRTVHILACFITRLHIERCQPPVILPLDHTAVDAVTAAYDEWLSSAALRPDFTAITIGTPVAPEESLAATASAQRWIIISHPIDSDQLDADQPIDNAAQAPWQTRIPQRFGDRLAVRCFLDLLKPETTSQRLSRIKTGVDELLTTYPGHITVARVAEQTHCRQSVIVDAFHALQDAAPDRYRLYQHENQVAIRAAKPQERILITRPSEWRAMIRRHALGVCGVAAGVVAWRVGSWFHVSGSIGLACTVLFGYAGNQVQAAVLRQAQINKE